MHEPSDGDERAAAAPHGEDVGLSGSLGAPVLAPDGDAFDAELERRWTSVRAGLVDVLSALEERANKAELQKILQTSAPARSRKRPKKVDPSEWMRVYSDAALLFSHNDPAKKRRMYGRVRELLRGYVRDQLVALRKCVCGSGVSLLEEYTIRWDLSLQFVRYMKRVLHHLEHWVLLNSCNRSKMDPIRPLDRLLMFYWCEDVLSNLPELVNILLDMIDDDRKGKSVEHGPVKAVIDTLVMLGSADAPPPTVGTPSSPTRRSQSTRRGAGTSASSLSGGGGSAGRARLQERSRRYDEAGRLLGAKEEIPLSLHLYLQVFEDEFLRRTAAFYSAEAEKMMRGNCVSTFMRNVVSRLEEEIARGERLLHKDSVPRLRSTVEEKLVGAHMLYLQQEADVMVREGRENDLKMVFKLLERLDGGLAPIRDCLSKHIAGEGLETMNARVDVLNTKEDVKKSIVIVDDLVALHRSRSEMIHRCFGNAQIFVMALNDAFRSFANKHVGALSMPEILAYYVDNSMRNPHSPMTWGCEVPGLGLPDTGPLKGSRTIGLSAVQQSHPPNLDPSSEQMDSLVRLFMYLDDKDMFHETYRRLLAKRLLGKHDDEMEREFICKLTREMGSLYTSKLSGMLKDVAVSNEAKRKFLDYLSAADATPPTEVSKTCVLPAHGIEFSAHVLNGLYWPSFQTGHLRIPRSLMQCQESFSSFFRRDQQLRKVTWIHSQSTNQVVANLNEKEYTLVVSTFQACALLGFNTTNRLTLEALSSSLNVEPAAMARHMQPLVNSKKHKLFVCHGDVEKITAEVLPAFEGIGTADNMRAAEIPPPQSEVEERRPYISIGGRALFGAQRGAPALVEVGGGVGPMSGQAVGDEGEHSPGPLDRDATAEAINALIGTSSYGHNASHTQGPFIGPPDIDDGNDDDNDYAIEDDDSPDIDAVVPPVGAPRDLASIAMAAAATTAGSNVPETSNTAGGSENLFTGFAADPELGTEKYRSNSLVRLHQRRFIGRQEGTESRSEENEAGGKIIDGSLRGETGRHTNDESEEAGAISDTGDEGDASLGEVDPSGSDLRGSLGRAGRSDTQSFPNGRESGDVVYELVDFFSSKSVRIVYPATIARLTTREAARGRNVVVVDRGSLLDAALVRIMKQRKSLPLTQLTGEAMQQVSSIFKADIRVIKERVEVLIDREFIVRSPDDPGVLLYCA
jgi:hypothetical protein